MRELFLLAVMGFALNANAEFWVSYHSEVTGNHRIERDEITSVLRKDDFVEVTLGNWHSAPAVFTIKNSVILEYGISVERFEEILNSSVLSENVAVLKADLVEYAGQRQVDVIKIESLRSKKRY